MQTQRRENVIPLLQKAETNSAEIHGNCFNGATGRGRRLLLDSACSVKVPKWLREEQRKLETALNQSFEEASPISLVNSIFPEQRA